MRRQGFTLVELLVAIAIIVVLVTLASVAASAARTSARETATRALINRLSGVLEQHIDRCSAEDASPLNLNELSTLQSQNIPAGAFRSWRVRRQRMNGDLPDRWDDVKYMADNRTDFRSPAQRAYVSIWDSLPSYQRLLPGEPGYNASQTPPPVAAQWSGAECLFMVVMRGGIADCLSCGSLAVSMVGDTDSDGMPEFLDGWGRPIDYVLWPAGIKLPVGSDTLFFSGDRQLDNPFGEGVIRPSLGMRPLIYSAGADGAYCLNRALDPNAAASTPREQSMLAITASGPIGPFAQGRDCGNPLVLALPPYSICDVSRIDRDGDGVNEYDGRADNLTNLDQGLLR